METPRRLKAFCWIGVGLAVMVKGSSGVRAVTTVFRVRVMRSAIRVWKLWTGSPSSVRLLVCLLTAAGERWALATALSRRALGRCLVVVIVEHGRELGTHVPLDMVGQHAQEDVCAHAITEPVVNGANVKIDSFYAPEGSLNLGEPFVCAHGFGVVMGLLCGIGAAERGRMPCLEDVKFLHFRHQWVVVLCLGSRSARFRIHAD